MYVFQSSLAIFDLIVLHVIPCSKKIRLSHKFMNLCLSFDNNEATREYGGIKSVPNQPNKSSSQNKAAPSSSNALVLSGTETSKNGDLTTTASAQPKNL
ncbi:hypothetical protein LXL04_032296 [Taraxacum kok-saghyz]